MNLLRRRKRRSGYLSKLDMAELMVSGTRFTVNDPLKAVSMVNTCIKYHTMGNRTLAKKVGILEKSARRFKQNQHLIAKKDWSIQI